MTEKLAKGDILLLDIEGTVTSITFVKVNKFYRDVNNFII